MKQNTHLKTCEMLHLGYAQSITCKFVVSKIYFNTGGEFALGESDFLQTSSYSKSQLVSHLPVRRGSKMNYFQMFKVMLSTENVFTLCAYQDNVLTKDPHCSRLGLLGYEESTTHMKQEHNKSRPLRRLQNCHDIKFSHSQMFRGSHMKSRN